MNLGKKIVETLRNPYKLVVILGNRGYLNWVNDKVYLKLMYRSYMKKKLNLDNPKTFNEKLQWLKLYNRNPMYTILVDKYEVRDYIEKLALKINLIPLIGVYDSVEEIKFDDLPDEFVLKTTHDSGGVVICKNKSLLDIEKSCYKLKKSLSKNYYYSSREWPYKNIKPRIICEQIIKDKYGKLPVDYKFHCFNGKVDNVMLCVDRDSGNPKFYFFDREWNLLRYNKAGINADKDFTLPKPKMIDEMFNVAEELAKDLPFVRVDLYCENNKIYFGELTFFPDSGFDSNLLEETDLLFGNKIKLNSI